MSTEPHLLTERRGHVLVVTMNRPEAKNALSGEMLARMYDAWVELSEDDDLRCGSSPDRAARSARAWTSRPSPGARQETEWTKRFQEDDDLHWKALLRHRPTKPLIAAVEGFALAGGTEILQGTDIRVAGTSAVFGDHRGGLGPVPARRLDGRACAARSPTPSPPSCS